ncbi:MAG: packaged DNA stabilization gp4 family protein [Novosphingobium sp.]
MTTARDIIERAMRRIGVVAMDEAMTADQAASAVNALNDMMHGWSAHGIAYTHADIGLNDAFPIDDKWRNATVMLLAERLAPDYGISMASADDSLRALQAGFMVIPDATIPSALLRTSSQRDLALD